MRLADPTLTMEAVVEKLAPVRTRVDNNGWTLRKGIRIVVNPKFKCPHCYENTYDVKDMSRYMYPTNRIWMFDERNRRLLGCWWMDGTEVEDDGYGEFQSVVHPHVGGTGNLCMGSSTSVEQLLFMGMSKGNHYRSCEIAILNMGHMCPYIPRVPCKICTRKYLQPLGRVYGNVAVCSFDCVNLSPGQICNFCGGNVRDVELPDYYNGTCHECFNRLAATCMGCSSRRWARNMRYVSRSRHYCETCVSDPRVLIGCAVCSEPTSVGEVNRDGYCLGCTPRSCRNCYSSKRTRDLVDGLCSYCQPPKYHCRCGTKVRSTGGNCNMCRSCPAYMCCTYIGRNNCGLPIYCRVHDPDGWANIPEIQNETEDQRDLDQGSGRNGVLRLSFLNERSQRNHPS